MLSNNVKPQVAFVGRKVENLLQLFRSKIKQKWNTAMIWNNIMKTTLVKPEERFIIKQHTNDTQIHTSDMRMTYEWHTSDTRMIYECIWVTYEWRTYEYMRLAYEWHTNHIWMAYECLRVTYKWHKNGIRVHIRLAYKWHMNNIQMTYNKIISR